MKYNFPIRYACMPIYEQVGWIHGLNELEEEYGVIGYIAAKCYLISEKNKYNQDGSQKKEYEVVFPYTRDNCFYNTWNSCFPEYNFYNKCTNSIVVTDIFNTFDEAKEKVNSLNEKIKLDACMYIPFNEDFYKKVEEIHEDFDLRLSKYLELESEIEVKTNEMLNNINKPQNIIAVSLEGNKILPMSLYNFIELYKHKSFLVCSVSLEDYQKQINLIRENESLDEQKLHKIIFNDDNYLLAHKKDDDIITIVNNNHEDKGSYYLTKNNFLRCSKKICCFDKDVISDYDIKIYTPETYEDIINSYKYDKIELNKLKRLTK